MNEIEDVSVTACRSTRVNEWKGNEWRCECHSVWKCTCEWVRKKRGEEVDEWERREWECERHRVRKHMWKSGWCVFVFVCCCFPQILPIFLYSKPRGVQHKLWTIVEWCEQKLWTIVEFKCWILVGSLSRRCNLSESTVRFQKQYVRNCQERTQKIRNTLRVATS